MSALFTALALTFSSIGLTRSIRYGLPLRGLAVCGLVLASGPLLYLLFYAFIFWAFSNWR